MERVIVACVHGSTHHESVVRWARQEATRRGLALRVVRDGPADGLNDAQLVVAGARDPDGVMFPARPVVLVPEAPAAQRFSGPGAEIVLGVDAREPAQAAVGFAFDAARVRGVRLRAVHSWRFPACAAELRFGVPEEDRATWEDHEVQLLGDALRPWREKHSDVHVLEDVRLLPPARALSRRSASAGLVVVGRSAEREPGPTLRALLAEALCPVAVVPT
ncbi:universal stress protein [Streptomyces canus]|uniref:universal stress protein n=1 Tax=Streptomyces canus TaxID=58343 RepID=UPI002E34EC5E|nr:universal stress protein [Streptomyces canus]